MAAIPAIFILLFGNSFSIIGSYLISVPVHSEHPHDGATDKTADKSQTTAKAPGALRRRRKTNGHCGIGVHANRRFYSDHVSW